MKGDDKNKIKKVPRYTFPVIVGVALHSCKAGDIVSIQLPHEQTETEFLKELKEKLQVTDFNTLQINKLINKRIKFIKNKYTGSELY